MENGVITGKLVVTKPVEYKSMMAINDSLQIQFDKLMPNWFHRKMHLLFFGFKWKDLRK